MQREQSVSRHPLSPVPLASVVLEDEFWSPKRGVWQDVTIRDALRKFEADGAITNFDRVRDGQMGGHDGPPWYDGLIYEMIRGASDFLALSPDPALDAQLDGYIERIAAAAAVDSDGYINTYTQLEEPGHRWGLNGGLERWQHEVYNAGALVEAAIHQYQATGKTALLDVAVKFANHMCGLMGPAPKQNIVPSHSLPEEALVNLHLLFCSEPQLKDRLSQPAYVEKYLQLAEFWLEARGHHAGKPDWERDGRKKSEENIRNQEYGSDRPSWGAYAQDHLPLLEQESIEGHAVRATLLCTGLAAAARVNGRDDYHTAALRLWNSLVSHRMYITGGVGSFAEEEKFASDYELPNDGYQETCAAVGAAFFHRNMNLAFGHARFVDELERVLYNGALGGVSIGGDTYFYENPLAARRGRARWSWHRCPCCPPMFLKLMGAMPGYIYASDDDGIYVNLFVSSRGIVPLKGDTVVVRQITRYPWEGFITVTVEPEHAGEFALNMRIPAWADGFSIKVNGVEVADTELIRGYARISRHWHPGDILNLEFPLVIERMKAHPHVDAAIGRTAIMRGPIVYCLEGGDHGGSIATLFLPRSAELTGEFRGDLLEGVVVIRGRGYARDDTGWQGSLYARQTSVPKAKEVPLLAIPYYANANRTPDEMTVWIPECD